MQSQLIFVNLQQMGAAVTNLRRHDEPFSHEAIDTLLPDDNIEAMKARDREEYALRETKVDTLALRTQLIGECSVCLDVFSAETTPCLLVCGHNVCETCVKSLHHVRCPLCRAKFEDMPMRDVAMCKYIDAVTIAAPVLAAVDIKSFVDAKLLQTWQDVAHPSMLELKRAVARVVDLTKEKEELTATLNQKDAKIQALTDDHYRTNDTYQVTLHELRRKMDKIELKRQRCQREADDMRKELDNLTKSSAEVEASLQAKIQNHNDVVRKLKETHDVEMHEQRIRYNSLHIKYEQQVCRDDTRYSDLQRKYDILQHDYDTMTLKVLFHQNALPHPKNAYSNETETTMRWMRIFIACILQENDELRQRDNLGPNPDLHQLRDEICTRMQNLEEETRLIHLHNKHILTRELQEKIDRYKRQTQTVENIAIQRDQALDELAALKAVQMQNETTANMPMHMRGNSNNSFPIQLTAESVRLFEQMNNCGPGHMVINAEWITM
jgi:zinc-RING finger domain